MELCHILLCCTLLSRYPRSSPLPHRNYRLEHSLIYSHLVSAPISHFSKLFLLSLHNMQHVTLAHNNVCLKYLPAFVDVTFTICTFSSETREDCAKEEGE
jgi:hypothetical protein